MRSQPDLPKTEGPAIYRVRVLGTLDRKWARDVSGMDIKEEVGPKGDRRTILVGHLPDQAALLGVLNALYEMHLPVLSVDCEECE
ncbi:MAG: hypothetical protein ACWGSQ_03590 [Longimicrobiales bacterium]